MIFKKHAYKCKTISSNKYCKWGGQIHSDGADLFSMDLTNEKT